MRILLETHHPAHIHFFKYPVQHWVGKGYDIRVIGRDRDVMRSLSECYSWMPTVIPPAPTGGKKKTLAFGQFASRQLRVAREILRFKPDLLLSLMGSYTQSSFILNVPQWIFTDSEFQHFNHRIAHPFTKRIYTPECFYKPLGPKQIRYPSYHELAFLHPDRFKPRKEVLTKLGLTEGERYAIIRLSAWDTYHDIKHGGIRHTLNDILDQVKPRARCFIVPEGGRLPEALEPLRFPCPPDWFHDALAFAHFVITEGASTASEAACLGTPAIYINDTEARGYLEDQQKRYQLVYGFPEPQQAIDQIDPLLERLERDPESIRNAHKQLIDDHVDLSQYVIDQVAQFADEQQLA
ncbi:MAG: DUF354 domain-containing protein [Verrucomicrobiota bacterium]